MSLDQSPWHPEPLAALMSDSDSCPMRFVQFRCGKDTIATDAATQPCCIRFLIGERTGFHGAELGREQLSVTAADAKDNKRVSVADHGRADSVRQLIRVLVREAEMELELASLGEKRRKGIGAECLKFVDTGKERNALVLRHAASFHRNQLKMRNKQ